MNIYKAIQQDKGDILLEKITLDDTNYKIINKDNAEFFDEKNNINQYNKF